MLDRRTASCLLSVAVTVVAIVSVRAQPRALAITRVSVIDVVDGRIAPNSTVTIGGKTITSVRPNGVPPAGARVVDGEGKLAPGQRADLAMLDANPLTDITNVQRVGAVVVAGRLLERKDLDKMLAQVKIAAARP